MSAVVVEQARELCERLRKANGSAELRSTLALMATLVPALLNEIKYLEDRIEDLRYECMGEDL